MRRGQKIASFVSGAVAVASGALTKAPGYRLASSRSLDTNDPFGEKASWENPGDGQLFTFKKFDEAAFAAAASSSEAQPTHFGPQWAKFTTVGRLSTKAIHSKDPMAKPPTAEDLHAAELQRKDQAMSRNYSTYEEFVQAELDEAQRRLKRSSTGDDGAEQQRRTTSRVNEEDSGEVVDRSVIAEDPQVSGYRVAQLDRSAIRVASQQDDGHEDAAAVSAPPLPAFFVAGLDNANSVDELDTRQPPPPAHVSAAEASAQDTLSSQPSSVNAEGLSAADPLHWTTDEVVSWLTRFSEPGAMDDSMSEAFHMIRVDGNMLLNRVMPNTLFKIMRRWHLQRSKGAAADGGGGGGAPPLPDTISQTLIQETIYLCYPYGR